MRADSLRADSLRRAQPPRRASRVPCSGQPIRDVYVVTLPPYPEGTLRRWRLLSRATRAMHVTTRPQVIQRYLLLERGQPCSELRRTESERILRAQPFLADARVGVFDGGDGSVWVEVETIDELSVVAGGSIQSQWPQVRALMLGEGNVAGEAIHLSGEWRDGGFYRDEIGMRFVDYQLLGRPYQLEVSGARRERGSRWFTEMSHPFFTDLQRLAWRVAAGQTRDFFTFERATLPRPSLREERRFVDVGGVIRLGVPGRLSLFGASLSHEKEITRDAPVIISDSGLIGDTTTFARPYGSHATARLNALWGVRNLRFIRVEGFDALTAAQDMREGFQLSTLFGRSLSVIGADDDDIFVSTDVYAAHGSPRAFAALQVQGEGRQNYDVNRWDGVFAAGHGAGYFKFGDRHTFMPRLEFAAGWRTRVPFQLTLHDTDGGIRGYHSSRAAGAQRVVARLEDRWLLGSAREYGDIALALFSDAGRLWAGDAPFGTDTEIKVGVGLGLLAAVPARSKRVWRLDLAVPVSRDPDAGWEIRLSNHDRTRLFWRVPQDVRRSRETSIPASVFTWP